MDFFITSVKRDSEFSSLRDVDLCADKYPVVHLRAVAPGAGI